MGLDMYLSKKIYVGAQHEFNKISGEINISANGKPLKVDFSKVQYIIEAVGYWRKANQIHNWFVNNIQDGKDECQESYVPVEKLKELKLLCELVLRNKDASLLPPAKGFFFGGTEIDNYYYEDLKDTIQILNSLDETGEYYYQASW